MTHHESGTGTTVGESRSLDIELDLLKVRVSSLEKQVRALAEAIPGLARGMEAGPLEEPGRARPEHAAQLVHELLLAAGLVSTGGESA